MRSDYMKEGVSRAPHRSLLKALGVTAWIVGIWCLLALIGGVGMYIYDCRLSRTECINLAARYVEAGRIVH